MRKLVEPDVGAQVGIRRMRAEDLDAVVELQKRAFKHPWSPELVKRELTHDWSTILLAEDAPRGGPQRIAGFMIFWLVHDELHILNIATDPDYRRRGIARKLLEETLATARNHKCAMATLEVRRSNEAAIELYRSYNFRAVGIRPNYYVDEGEDAIVMIADL